MQPAGAYPLFGTTHLLTIAAMFVMGGIIVYGARRWIAPDRRKYVAISLGLFMFAQEVLDRRLHHYLGNEPWRNVLPFHLCGMSVVLTVILFITRKRSLYDLLYFWGLAGAGMAILTPDIQFAFPHILNLTYFWSHALIIVGVAFMTVNYGYRPYFKSFLRALVLTNLYLVLVIPTNMALGANYLYLCEKPKEATLIDLLGPWPWYILGLEIIGTALFFIMYSPYLIADLLHAKTNRHS